MDAGWSKVCHYGPPKCSSRWTWIGMVRVNDSILVHESLEEIRAQLFLDFAISISCGIIWILIIPSSMMMNLWCQEFVQNWNLNRVYVLRLHKLLTSIYAGLFVTSCTPRETITFQFQNFLWKILDLLHQKKPDTNIQGDARLALTFPSDGEK